MSKVIIAGGGVSGLSVGFELLERGLEPDEVAILEAGPRAGGNLWAERADGFLVEAGPNGFLDNSPPTLELAGRLGLEDRLLRSNEAAAVRHIYSRGALRRVPSGPGGLLGSGLLSLPGRLRVMLEPFVRGGGHPGESVFDFAARRIGSEAAASLVSAMAAGVFAGDARRLELASAFPKMAAMEAGHGTLTRAMIARRRARRKALKSGDPEAEKVGGPSGPAGVLTSFLDGIEELPRALARRLEGSLRTGVPVKRLERTADDRWRALIGETEALEARAVVLACPAWESARITKDTEPRLASLLEAIPPAPITVVATAYRAEEIGGDPHGFGLLVAPGHGPRILGCLWTSSIWSGRAPHGTVLLRTMVGGARDPRATELEEGELLELVARDLKTTMGIEARPLRHWIFRHPEGIAQYVPGHGERLERIRALLEGAPGLFVSGSSYGGISVNHCAAEAPEVARRVMDSLID